MQGSTAQQRCVTDKCITATAEEHMGTYVLQVLLCLPSSQVLAEDHKSEKDQCSCVGGFKSPVGPGLLPLPASVLLSFIQTLAQNFLPPSRGLEELNTDSLSTGQRQISLENWLINLNATNIWKYWKKFPHPAKYLPNNLYRSPLLLPLKPFVKKYLLVI